MYTLSRLSTLPCHRLCAIRTLTSTSKPLLARKRQAREATGSEASTDAPPALLPKTPIDELTPEEIVKALDEFVIGQHEAKKATGIALRTRWRRMKIDDPEFRKEVTPTNIIIKGPTGSGKTEIARRKMADVYIRCLRQGFTLHRGLARLADTPFVKVEATRFTEVGFVGDSPSSMIKELMDVAYQLEKELAKKQVAEEAREKAEGQLLDLLNLPKTSEEMREKLRRGDFDHMTVKMSPRGKGGVPSFLQDLLGGGSNGPDFNFEDMLKGGGAVVRVNVPMSGGMGSPRRGPNGNKQQVSVKKALERLIEELEESLLVEEDIIQRAREKAENFGIVVIDEIDKLLGSTMGTGGFSKGEGVQRELLTLVEGCNVRTRYGNINTDMILFIASGAFHSKSPADLLPELQGRFPVRVELKPLGKADLVCVLSKKKYNLLEQITRLLATEGIEVEVTKDGIDAIADFAEKINRSHQDIGARRLNTVLQRVTEDISYKAAQLKGHKVVIDEAFVTERLKDFDPVKQNSLAKYIL